MTPLQPGDDETVEEVQAAFDRGEKGLTAPPALGDQIRGILMRWLAKGAYNGTYMAQLVHGITSDLETIVLPTHAAIVRAKVAEEIEAHMSSDPDCPDCCLPAAVNIARGKPLAVPKKQRGGA